MSDTSRRRGFNPILAFILGFLFGLIALVGAVVGGVFFALNYKIDNIGANKDEDGKYIYVNGDPDSGGAKNVLELVTLLAGLAGDESLCLEKISEIFPIAEKLSTDVFNSLGEYIDVGYEDVKKVAFGEMGTFLQEKIMDVQPAKLLNLVGGGSLLEGQFGELIDIILNGKEAEYAYSGEEQYPVFYDIYSLTDSGYTREDGTPLNPRHEGYLVEKGEEYRLYFYRVSGVNYVTCRGDDNEYLITSDRYDNFDGSKSTLTGTYYIDNDGERVGDYVTLRSFAEGTAFTALNEVYVTELLGDNCDEITEAILGELTLGELLDGADFEAIINKIEISQIVDIDPDNHIMVYLAYGVKDVFKDADGNYSGKYTFKDGTTVDCVLETQNEDGVNKVTGAYYTAADGAREQLPATVVSDMSDRLESITEEIAISDLMTVSEPTEYNRNAIMIFLAFSVTDVEKADGAEYSYTGSYYFGEGEEYADCYLICTNGEITDAYYYENGVKQSVKKTAIADVSTQVNRLTHRLKLKDIIEIDPDNKVMAKIGEYTVATVGNAVDELTLDDFIDVTVSGDTPATSEVVLAYVVYGVSGIRAEAGTVADRAYTHRAVYNHIGGGKSDCYLTVEHSVVTGAFYIDNGVAADICGTTVMNVNERISGVTEDITIGQLMDVSGNKLLEAISDSTVSSLPNDINNLAINELYADNIYGNAAAGEEPVRPAIRYLAVGESAMHRADGYAADCVYYFYEHGEYSLASTTGKISGFEADKTYYTCGEGKILFNTAYIYYTQTDGKFKQAENGGKVSFFEENVYYTYGAANAMWKILLYSEKDGVKTEVAYSVNNLTSMISNVKDNTQKTTMRELHEAGIMTFSDESDLDTQIVYNGKPTTIGELTLEDFVSFFIAVAKDPSILLKTAP